MPTRVPIVERWTPAKGLAATAGVLVAIPVGYVVTLWGWADWCVTVGSGVTDDLVVELDLWAVTRGMLVEHAGIALWAVPWLLLAILRRRHHLEAAVFAVLAAMLLVWNTWGAVVALTDPVAAEQTQCWHF